MREMEAARHLRRMENVLILTHVRPDGDTVGCAAALCLENTAPYVTPYEAPLDFQPEYVVSVDIAATQLLPENAKMYAGQIELAIDHHPSFEHFGQQNIVRPEAGACGELVYDILRHLTAIDAEIALPLLCLRQHHAPYSRGGGGADVHWY